jgi:hypothetical protein
MKYLKNKYKKATLLSQCLLLFFKNIILIRTLKLNSVLLYDRVIIENNEIEIHWIVKGCHKIKVKGIGVFPGNNHGLKFMFSNRHNPIEITFFGISNKIKKKIEIESTKINLLDKFIAITKIPNAIEIPYIKQEFESELSKDILNVELQSVSFEFAEFNIDNYKPVNIIQ